MGVPSYGVRQQRSPGSAAVEELLTLGYCVLDSGYSKAQIRGVAQLFDRVRKQYVDTFGLERLKACNEHNGIRLPLAFDASFVKVAMNPAVLGLVASVIDNQFILNQQNGVINPPREGYNQGAWHRDLPYQHFVASKPLGVNALYCVDDFTADNGASHVLPGSHQHEAFPSDAYVEKMAKQVVAPAGSFILMHAMLFHRGGANRTARPRRAVNHLYTTAFIKQQIDIPAALAGARPPAKRVADLLGFRYRMPRSVADFLDSRRR